MAAFKALLADVRQRDCCFECEEHELAVQALAVPLRDMSGRTVAALNVVTSPRRTTQQALERDILPLMHEAARLLRPQL